jgi:hypothetical protein
MKMIKATNNEVSGSSLVGYLSIDYKTLVKVFGKPSKFESGDKRDAEWRCIIDGCVCTIYNYKDGHNYLGSEGTNVTKIDHWHIG